MPSPRKTVPLPADLVVELGQEAKRQGMTLTAYVQRLLAVARQGADGTKDGDTLSLDELELVAVGQLRSVTKALDVKHITEVAERLTALRERHGLLVKRDDVFIAQEAQGQAIDNALSPALAAAWGVDAKDVDRLRRELHEAIGAVWA